jgi:2-keto-4-pentenoate hydratase/2-oxohepta-3-ene-1,7-dioic acid hydratase in catechol pathway
MRLMRYGPVGQERPGLVAADGTIRSLAGVIDDLAGNNLGDDAIARLLSIDPATLAEVPAGVRLGPCVGRVGKLIGIGLNYADHAQESGMPIPAEPLIFMKATSAIAGPFDPVEMPRGATKLDWEVELGVVIGTSARYVSQQQALDHVAGYCVVNDISERAFQLEGTGQWVKGKSSDGFAPLGPWLVTRDEIPDPQNLSLWLEVGGHRFQDGSTATMVFGPAELVSYLSRFMTLHPGDVITTGTPPGVALGMAAPRWLQPGDVMRLGVEGLGIQQQTVVAAR